MALWGTIVNAIAIIAGSLLGRIFPGIPERIHKTVMQGLAMAIMILGITMAIKTENFLILIVSLVLGGILGELLKLEYRLQQFGGRLEKIAGKIGKGSGSRSIAEGFVTATLVYCIGAMAILGALESGMKHDHAILFTKAMLDGISAIVFSSTLGIGVALSAIPVFLYQGTIALSATFISQYIGEGQLQALIAEVSAVGGVLIVGIGLNLLNLVKINVANLLPSVLVAALAVLIVN